MPDTPDEVTEILVDEAPDPEPHPSLDIYRDPAGDPDHPRWQGHTHIYPKRRRKDGTKVCRECSFVQFPEPPDGGLTPTEVL